MEVPVARVLKDFCGLFRNSFMSRTSSREIHLESFFFLKSSGEIESKKTHVFCFKDSFKNLFCVFTRTLVTIHCLPRLNLSQTHRVSKKKTPFSLKSQLQSSKKGIGFHTITTYFIFLALFFLICELFLSIVILGVSVMGWVHICCVWVFGFG